MLVIVIQDGRLGFMLDCDIASYLLYMLSVIVIQDGRLGFMLDCDIVSYLLTTISHLTWHAQLWRSGLFGKRSIA